MHGAGQNLAVTRTVGFSLTHSQPNSSMFPASFVPYFSLLVFSPRTSLFKSLDPALCRNPRSFVHPPPSPSCPPYLCVFYIYFYIFGLVLFFLYFSFCSPVRRDTLRPACNYNSLQARAQPIKKRLAQATCSSHLLKITARHSTGCITQTRSFSTIDFCCSQQMPNEVSRLLPRRKCPRQVPWTSSLTLLFVVTP